MQTRIPAGEFKARCLRLMDQVARSGRPLVITKHGRPVVKLVPISPGEPEFGCMKDGTRIIGDIVAPIGERWNADA